MRELLLSAACLYDRFLVVLIEYHSNQYIVHHAKNVYLNV